MSFACNARYFLITYSQCGTLDEWSVVDRFAELGAECIVAREHHQVEGVHLHVFADFGRKFRSRKTDVFDVGGFHPNIQPTRWTPASGYDYATKDGDIVAGGLARPEERSIRHSAADSKWSEIAGARSRDEFWELCQMLDPKSYVTCFPALQKFADWNFRDIPTPYATPPGITFDLSRYSGCDDWLQQSGIGLGESHIGASCTFALVLAVAAPEAQTAGATTTAKSRGFGALFYISNLGRKTFIFSLIWCFPIGKDTVG